MPTPLASPAVQVPFGCGPVHHGGSASHPEPALGVFCGKYMTDCRNEFPPSWFAHAKLSPSGRDCSLNFFGVDASQPLSVWRKKGWIHLDDPHGWFQWYSRYYMDRRMPDEDARQRSSAGRQSDGTSRRSSGTASRAIQRAGHVSVRLCCTRPMTAARFDETVLMLRGALRPSGVPAATGMVATAHRSANAGRPTMRAAAAALLCERSSHFHLCAAARPIIPWQRDTSLSPRVRAGRIRHPPAQIAQNARRAVVELTNSRPSRLTALQGRQEPSGPGLHGRGHPCQPRAAEAQGR